MGVLTFVERFSRRISRLIFRQRQSRKRCCWPSPRHVASPAAHARTRLRHRTRDNRRFTRFGIQNETERATAYNIRSEKYRVFYTYTYINICAADDDRREPTLTRRAVISDSVSSPRTHTCAQQRCRTRFETFSGRVACYHMSCVCVCIYLKTRHAFIRNVLFIILDFRQ